MIALYKHSGMLIPIKQRTKKMTDIIIKRHQQERKRLRKLAYYQFTRSIIREGLSNHKNDIKNIPHDLLTVELLHFVIKECGLWFRKIPKHMRTSEIALYCITNDIRNFGSIPRKLQTQEMIDTLIDYINKHRGCLVNMENIANRFKTEEIILMIEQMTHYMRAYAI